MLLKKLFRQFLVRFGIAFLLVLTLFLGGIYLAPTLPKYTTIIAQNTLFFTLFRWFLMSVFFLLWPCWVRQRAKSQQWSQGITLYWLSQRFRVVFWLILFELLVCENLLWKSVHWFFQ